MTHPREATNRYRKARALADTLLRAGADDGTEITPEQWALAASVAGKGIPSEATKAIVREMLREDTEIGESVKRSADYHWWWDAPDGKKAGVGFDDWRERKKPKAILHRVQTGTGLREHLEDPDNPNITLCGSLGRELVSYQLPPCAVCRMAAEAEGHLVPRTWAVTEGVL